MPTGNARSWISSIASNRPPRRSGTATSTTNSFASWAMALSTNLPSEPIWCRIIFSSSSFHAPGHWRHTRTGQSPISALRRRALPDRAAMDEFVDQTKTLVGALGWDLFREVRGRVTETAQDPEGLPDVRSLGNLRFSFRGKGFAAEMALGPSGDFVVLSGPKARVRTTATTPRGTPVLRGMLIDKGVLSQVGDRSEERRVGKECRARWWPDESREKEE